ncbi:MAG: alternative ribosome rescue aminoacyl-tRNA hydrolase ArfB [Planctomycetota bacterium]
MNDLYVNSRLTIPADRLAWSASRSSGPGGQNVNKVNSKVTLRFDFAACPGLDAGWEHRFRTRFGTRIRDDGVMVLQSDVTRDQHRNLADVRARLAAMLVSCAAPPKARKPTRPSRGSQRRRLEKKRQTGEKKKARRRRFDRGD